MITTYIDGQLKKFELIRPEIELMLYNSFFFYNEITFFLFVAQHSVDREWSRIH